MLKLKNVKRKIFKNVETQFSLKPLFLTVFPYGIFSFDINYSDFLLFEL